MTLQTSGQISMHDIAEEFGGTTPHSMSEYRGAGHTPATGPISFSDFYGKKLPTWTRVADDFFINIGSTKHGILVGYIDGLVNLINESSVRVRGETTSLRWQGGGGAGSAWYEFFDLQPGERIVGPAVNVPIVAVSLNYLEHFS